MITFYEVDVSIIHPITAKEMAPYKIFNLWDRQSAIFSNNQFVSKVLRTLIECEIQTTRQRFRDLNTDETLREHEGQIIPGFPIYKWLLYHTKYGEIKTISKSQKFFPIFTGV